MRVSGSYIGNKAFYKRVLTVMVPIMVQAAFTNFVNMLDNVMVGRVGNLEMTGVSVANQYVFIYTLIIFGAISGAGIFSAQYHGQGNVEGVRNSFRFKLLICSLMTLLTMAALLLAGDFLVDLYLKGEGAPESIAATHAFGRKYIRCMLPGMLPYAWCQCLSSTLRETDHATPPMVAGIIAVLTNLALNYILIFGHFGAPALGVEGAAVATVISRFVELGIVVCWTLRNPVKAAFFVGAFRHFRIPGELVKQIAAKGLPLMMNETLWSIGVAFVDQCYSLRGLDVVSAQNIAYTFYDLFSVAFSSAGAAVGILVGQQLGAAQLTEAKQDAKKLLAFSTFLGVLVGALFAGLSGLAPRFYITTPEVRRLAGQIMIIFGCVMPLIAYCNACYFIIRAGGKSLITMLTDCGYIWIIQLPVAYCVSRFTELPIVPFYILIQCLMLIKALAGSLTVRSGIWLKNLVEQEMPQPKADTDI